LRDLGSAPVPPPSAADHVRGPADAPLVIEYSDFECPYCAALAPKLDELRIRHVFRHFPVRSSHPRAWPAACAAEAAGRQQRFWEMHDLLFGDPARLEDPHLWQRAQSLGLDIERFEHDRRSEDARQRVQADFDSGLRAGVVTTPMVFVGGHGLSGRIDAAALADLLGPENQSPPGPRS
jgi:protein-disulfide isomerase